VTSFSLWTGTLRGIASELIHLEFLHSDQLPPSTRRLLSGLRIESLPASLQAVLSALAGANFSPDLTIHATPSLELAERPGLDLPLAIGLLAASGLLADLPRIEQSLWLGTLTPEGNVLPLPGTVSIVMAAHAHGLREAYVPAANAQEAALVEGVTIYPVTSLGQLLAHLRGEQFILPFSPASFPPSPISGVDLASIRGHWQVKRVLEIAAAGGHHLLLCGAAGVGKTLLAQAFPSLLAPLTREEQCEVTSRYSVQGLLTPSRPVITERPLYRLAPTSSIAEVFGETTSGKYGKLALAHHGVLLLEHLATFKPDVIKRVQAVLERRAITYRETRDRRRVVIPVHVQLLATMRPCPCGFFQDPGHLCRCTPEQLLHYRQSTPGLLQPCFDLTGDVPRQDVRGTNTVVPEESSAQVRQRVQAARDLQGQRFAGTSITCNANMTRTELDRYCVLEQSGQTLLQTALKEMSLEPQEVQKLLKVARTIADLEARPTIAPQHLAEAILYSRPSSWGRAGGAE
jgi:magnesium chelatase family protein